MRRALIAALLLAIARPVAASQQCHPLAGDLKRAPGLTTGLRLDAAGYRNPSYTGDYQGLAPTIGLYHPRVALVALLPAYRLTRNGRAVYGLGDLALALRVPVPAFTRGGFAAGFGLAATLPTGQARDDLGMGHVMLMPELWYAHQRERIQLTGTFGFARALTAAGSGAHNHGPRPIVNPMNLSEIDASFNAFLRVHPNLWIKLGAFGAAPVGAINPHGLTRLVVGSGLMLTLRRLELSAELQAPLAGAPFLARGVIQVGHRFELPRRHRPRAS